MLSLIMAIFVLIIYLVDCIVFKDKSDIGSNDELSKMYKEYGAD